MKVWRMNDVMMEEGLCSSGHTMNGGKMHAVMSEEG